jgi:CHASE3 domain sensor protein
MFLSDAASSSFIFRFLRWQESSVRLIILFMTLVLIVGLAFLIRMRVTGSTINSVEWVSHTYEVKATVFELAAALNDMEAAAFAAQSDPLSDAAAHRYGEARAHYAPLLQKLRDLTRDNPAQQERLGMLRVQIEGRVKMFDETLLNRAQGSDTEAGRGLTVAVARFPVDDVLDSIVSEEEALVRQRQNAADRRARTGSWIVAAVSVVQLLLLAGIIWSSETQLRRRLTAEASASQAIERARLIVATVREPIAVIASDLKVVTTMRSSAVRPGAIRRSCSGFATSR